MPRHYKIALGLCLSLLLTAFSGPQSGDFLELAGYMNARASAQFRTTDQNKVTILPPGTRAVVEEVTYFPQTGNYGLKIKVLGPFMVPQNQPVWVHFNAKNPNMRLSTTRPEPQTRAEIRRETTAVIEPALTNADADKLVNQIQGLNSPQVLVRPEPQCRDCVARRALQVTCQPQNSYLENGLTALLQSPRTSFLGNRSSGSSDLSACIRESQSISSGRFLNCPTGDDRQAQFAPKPCSSQNLIDVTERAFQEVFDCYKDFLSPQAGDPKVAKAMSRSLFSLINLESGFYTNVVSPTGSAGLGQFTNASVQDINRRMWNQLQDHARGSSKLSCQRISRMEMKPARPQKDCAMMSFAEDNPIKNLVYTLGHMKQVRTDVRRTLETEFFRQGIQVSDEDREKLLSALSNWGHNTGAYGIQAPLQDLLLDRNAQDLLRSGKVDDFMKRLERSVYDFHISYLKRRGQSEAQAVVRAREASRFHNMIQTKLRQAEARAGRQCEI